jgi:DNA-binding NarL/FixJ family response regulator
MLTAGIRLIASQFPEFVIAAEVRSGHEAVAACLAGRADLLVASVQLGGMSGTEALRRARQMSPHLRGILIADSVQQAVREHPLDTGAAWLSIADSPERFREAVEAAASARPYVSPEIAEALPVNGNRSQHQNGTGSLTRVEREVVRMLCNGYTNKAVAGELGIGLRTAEAHRSNIMNKLRAKSLADLVLYGVRNGVVSVEQADRSL